MLPRMVHGKAPEQFKKVSVKTSIDPLRFVLTRIDDTREGPNYENKAGRACGLRTSIVMFDTAAKETASKFLRPVNLFTKEGTEK